MADPLRFRDLWAPGFVEQQLEILRAQQQIQRDWLLMRDNETWVIGPEGVKPLAQPITGDVMISFLPRKEELDNIELTHVRSWILAQAAGEKKAWPGFQAVIRINGKGRYISGGTWEIREGADHIYVGNGGIPTPLWAPSCLMAIARFYRLEDEPDLVKAVQNMLVTIVARDVTPAMTDLAAGYNGSPIIEIAVNKKERKFVGRYPDEEGNPGPYRYLSGEVADVTGDDWVKLQM